MAFYFALLNVSKQKEINQEKSSHHHRRHRRHSIASVESPLLDYRLLPRPQLLSDDIVITNELAHHVEETHPSTSHAPLSRRCRGSARASKWVNDNHSHHQSHQLSTSRSHTRVEPPAPAAPLSRSKRMAFGGGGDRGRGRRGLSEEEGSGERRKRSRDGGQQDPDTRGTSTSTSEGRQTKPNKPKPIRNRQKSQSHSEDDLEEKQQKIGKKKEEVMRKGMKREGRRGKGKEMEEQEEGKKIGARGAGAMEKRALESKKDQLKPKTEASLPIPPPSKPAVIQSIGSVQGTSSSKIPVSTTPTSKTVQNALQSSFPLTISISSSSSRHFSPPASTGSIHHSVSTNGLKPNSKMVFRTGMGEDRPLNPSIFQMMAGSATDESGRSSSQMSNESTTPRRDDSPASSCEDSKEREVTMKLSGISMSSRSSEPRLKKVTFESSPYVISNSFLGDGAGSGVLVVRRNSGTAVRRMAWTSRQRDEVSGGDWWTPCEEEVMREEEQEEEANNQMNREIEKSQTGTRSILRRGLIRRRSTSDKSRLLAYRNTGFLSSSQERKSESTSTSRMTVSVDRAQYK